MVKGAIKISLRLALALLATALVLVTVPAGSAAQAAPLPGAAPKVAIVLLPNGTPVRRLDRIDGLAPGLFSAGLGHVAPDQTYLDISQGARAFNSLYDTALPLVLPRGDRVPRWRLIRERAESAPGSITPGLLTSTLNLNLSLRPGRVGMEMEPELVVPALMGADRRGRVARAPERCVTRDCRAPVYVQNAEIRDLPRLIAGLREHDMLIAIERPPPEPSELLTIGIAGRGFGGNLTSDTTRTEGYVLSTDIAPTILQRFGIEKPPEMTGRPIHSQGRKDTAALEALGQRLAVVASRRGPVLGLSVLIWVGLVAAALLVDLVRRRRPGAAFALALRLLALSAIYLPLVLLLGAALQPDLAGERLLLLLGAPLASAATLALAPGWRGLAIACGATVTAHAVDVLTGSPLISQSLMGPNPGLGVRFYGIGNELGATLSVLIMLGIGAGLAGFGPALNRRAGAAVFIAVALPLAAIFAAGRFGADVGSAMVIPAGAVIAAATLLRRPLLALAALAVPLVGLALLAVVDLVSGGDSHFQRTVLDSGESGDLIDTILRRLRLTGRSFVRAASGPFLAVTALVIALAVLYRGRIRGWVGQAPAAFGAGFLASIFVTLLGTLVNDSGVLLLEVGAAYLLMVTGFAWAESRPGRPGRG